MKLDLNKLLDFKECPECKLDFHKLEYEVMDNSGTVKYCSAECQYEAFRFQDKIEMVQNKTNLIFLSNGLALLNKEIAPKTTISDNVLKCLKMSNKND